MALSGIPESVNDFNLYSNGNKVIGVTSELELPGLEHMTSTVSGPGILGEFESPQVGHFSSTEITINFRVVDKDYFDMVDVTKALDLTVRAAIQESDPSTQMVSYKGFRAVLRGRAKTVTIGTARQRGSMDSSITFEATYVLYEYDGKPLLELDKLNGVYKQAGVDLLADIKSLT